MESLSTSERDAIEQVERTPMLALTQAWAAVNSGTRNLAGLATMAARLADAFAGLPGDLTLADPAPAETLLADGTLAALDHGRHLHLTVRPHAPVQILLTGHMDTVFPADHPFQDMRWQDDGSLNGPGVADMKGGLAVMLAALTAVEAGPLADRIGYEVVIGSDEETGSFSSAALIARAASGKAAALTYEPALPDGTLAGARGGTGNFSILVRGRSAHAGRNPDDGRNAILAAADIALRLAEARSPRLSVNPARIEGGGPNNVVPDLAILRVNFRPADAAEIARARAWIDATVTHVTAAHDVTVEVHGGFNRPPKPIDAGAARLFGVVKQAGADLGLDIGWRDTGGVCDGNNIAACGVPVVDTMGVRGGAIHSADEFLIPESLAERAALSALTILRIAEKGGL
ncbi:hydrolase [Sphingomonas sp. H39-1-10]|uniref:hydrolase n=1 Tax=Sphingomonas TaxID=13687 RepID=UPI000887E8FA|nr:MULTISPECIES: hydrolase [Sphingomonas]MDF0489452.1 hydrolase [Sphingomonas pollutisoli]SDA29290.1 glutamate carboxypeptidase [Sphingomonas sp. NFR15]